MVRLVCVLGYDLTASIPGDMILGEIEEAAILQETTPDEDTLLSVVVSGSTGSR